MRDGVPAEFEHEYVYGETRVWHDVRAFPADDGGLVVFYRDISAQKALESERARQARFLQSRGFSFDVAMRVLRGGDDTDGDAR